MDDTTRWGVTGGCTELAIDLQQLIASTGEVRGEEKVGQLANARRKPVVWVSSAVSYAHSSPWSVRTRAGIDVDWPAIRVEAVS